MAYRSHSSLRGCAACGGSHFSSSMSPVYDPCPEALAMTATRGEIGCGGGCRGSSCRCRTGLTRPPAARTYDRTQCPTFAVSCETKQALRDCAKVALCDLLLCASEVLCPDGRFDASRFERNSAPTSGDASAPRAAQPSLQTQLINCLGQAVCTFMHCVPQALCPEPCALSPAPIDCLPCDYAVEVLR